MEKFKSRVDRGPLTLRRSSSQLLRKSSSQASINPVRKLKRMRSTDKCLDRCKNGTCGDDKSTNSGSVCWSDGIDHIDIRMTFIRNSDSCKDVRDNPVGSLGLSPLGQHRISRPEVSRVYSEEPDLVLSSTNLRAIQSALELYPNNIVYVVPFMSAAKEFEDPIDLYRALSIEHRMRTEFRDVIKVPGRSTFRPWIWYNGVFKFSDTKFLKYIRYVATMKGYEMFGEEKGAKMNISVVTGGSFMSAIFEIDGKPKHLGSASKRYIVQDDIVIRGGIMGVVEIESSSSYINPFPLDVCNGNTECEGNICTQKQPGKRKRGDKYDFIKQAQEFSNKRYGIDERKIAIPLNTDEDDDGDEEPDPDFYQRGEDEDDDGDGETLDSHLMTRFD